MLYPWLLTKSLVNHQQASVTFFPHQFWFAEGARYTLEEKGICARITTQRDYREGWPLLTVETEANGDSKNKWKGSFLGWFVVLFMPVQEVLFCNSCSSRLNTKYFLHHRSLFQFISPHRPASWAAVVQGRLSLKGTQDWEFFWLRFWNLYHFFISYVKILRFYKKNFLIRPFLGEIRFFRVVRD